MFIKSAGEIAKKVSLSVLWNLLLIEINLSQISRSGSKREKVCVVCPYLLFYFRATLGVKEVLQSSKNSTSIFISFLIVHHSHSLKCVLEKMCVCVCLSVYLSIYLSVWTSPIVEPKPIYRSRSNSISRVLLQISLAFFLCFPLPLKLRVVHMRKKLKMIFSKMISTILIKFCGFIAHSKPNNMTLLAFPEKIHQIRKIVFIIFFSFA